MTRKGFLGKLLAASGAVLSLFGCGGGSGDVVERRYGRSLQFVAERGESVASATTKRYSCRLGSGPIFVEVGELQGDLQYLVNDRLVLMPAKDCVLKKGDVVTWRVVI
ncbi:MAG: hypothetical protein BWY43_00437 [candidate division WS2 bacterium ADurb.Bin280]|uniref:Uncharacterized protein n=1 Tax=candidate division WS2 bacterium ADurb.Bin280 TaxID=1852829 RepID=A0A1V5SDG5_9BACT|nr:MAG: hypothetical protein BWY43_00437 [candidate division WS2 bacterium ADurb.Bin280]